MSEKRYCGVRKYVRQFIVSRLTTSLCQLGSVDKSLIIAIASAADVSFTFTLLPLVANIACGYLLLLLYWIDLTTMLNLVYPHNVCKCYLNTLIRCILYYTEWPKSPECVFHFFTLKVERIECKNLRDIVNFFLQYFFMYIFSKSFDAGRGSFLLIVTCNKWHLI